MCTVLICTLKNLLLSRSVYTKRIIDISAKVRKQKEEIDRVLADTRTIQKEINMLSGKLERTFTVVEGTAYKVSITPSHEFRMKRLGAVLLSVE